MAPTQTAEEDGTQSAPTHLARSAPNGFGSLYARETRALESLLSDGWLIDDDTAQKLVASGREMLENRNPRVQKHGASLILKILENVRQSARAATEARKANGEAQRPASLSSLIGELHVHGQRPFNTSTPPALDSDSPVQLIDAQPMPTMAPTSERTRRPNSRQRRRKRRRYEREARVRMASEAATEARMGIGENGQTVGPARGVRARGTPARVSKVSPRSRD